MREQVEKLRALRKLTDEQASAVDVRAIVRFLRSDLAARIRKNAQTVRREYRFSLLRPVRDFATLDADDAVLLQGVVDCFFEENGELVVVDFKTDRIGRTQIEERAEHYRPQLETYSMALMRVMGKKVRKRCCISSRSAKKRCCEYIKTPSAGNPRRVFYKICSHDKML